MGYIRLRRRQFWSAGASEARPRFGSLGAELRSNQSAVAAALWRANSNVPRVAYPPDSSVICGDSVAFRVRLPVSFRYKLTIEAGLLFLHLDFPAALTAAEGFQAPCGIPSRRA